MVLLEVLYRLRRLLGVEIRVAHVHHGLVRGPQGAFRRRAWELVGATCARLGLPYLTNASRDGRTLHIDLGPLTESIPRSEDECRRLRWHFLQKWALEWEQEVGATVNVVFGHHRDDLLETRLLRLLRGTGTAGLVAMRVLDEWRLRPLLSFGRDQLASYAKLRHLSWVDDPSNAKSSYLRNWVRREWLPALEHRHPGAVQALARSLDSLANTFQPRVHELQDIIRDGAVDRQQLLSLSRVDREQCLAHYMRMLHLSNYSHRHVREILKRLDIESREHTFSLLGHRWRVTEKEIRMLL